MPRIAAETAALIAQHYQWIRDGMSIREGWRRWVKSGGPCDPRSTTGHMQYDAYRRMLANSRYMGRWAFGRKKNAWNSKLDYTRQVLQPDTEVTLVQSDELRIVSDELFFAVQERLAKFKLGHRGPLKKKDVQLWDLVTGLFICAQCKVRYYQAGANGHAMQCKNRDLCPCSSIVKRKDAVGFVCSKLTELIAQDADLIMQIVGRAQEIDCAGDAALGAEITRVEKKITSLKNKIDDLSDMAGQGSDDDRAELMAKVRAAQVERAGLQVDFARLQAARDTAVTTITPDQVRQMLGDLMHLLEDGAAGKLGEDAVYRAAAVFEMLVGGRIWVHVQRRAGGRVRTSVRGVFKPNLLQTVQAETGDGRPAGGSEPGEVEVFLRMPPKADLLAPRVHQLVDVQGLSLRAAATIIQQEGFPKMNSGIIWQIHRRYHEIQGQPAPDLNGRHTTGRSKRASGPAA
jgi:hypothetical protein